MSGAEKWAVLTVTLGTSGGKPWAREHRVRIVAEREDAVRIAAGNGSERWIDRALLTRIDEAPVCGSRSPCGKTCDLPAGHPDACGGGDPRRYWTKAQTPTSVRELHEHAVRMAMEAWDRNAPGGTEDFRAFFERDVRERLAQTFAVLSLEQGLT